LQWANELRKQLYRAWCVVEQPIKEAVITVPTFFNQAERRSVLRAGEMAGLKILQLMNDNTAGGTPLPYDPLPTYTTIQLSPNTHHHITLSTHNYVMPSQ